MTRSIVIFGRKSGTIFSACIISIQMMLKVAMHLYSQLDRIRLSNCPAMVRLLIN